MTAITEERLVSETEELVRYETVNPPGNELKLVDYLVERLESSPVNFELKRYDVEPTRPNLVARAGNPDRGSILLTGHTDVVPATAAEWTGDPFELRRQGDRIIGRGTSDMKGALAAKLIAAEAYLSEQSNPSEVVLAFVMDEEMNGTGTEALTAERLDVDGAIIGEPTELDVAIAEYGQVNYSVTVHGESSHSGRPDQGVNAIDKLRRILDEVETLADDIATNDHKLLTPGASLSLTEIDGGIAPNVIPDTATAELLWRTLPESSATPDEYDERLGDAIAAAEFEGEPITDVDVDRWLFFEGTDVDADHPFVRDVVDAINQVGVDSEPVGFNAGSDARYLRRQGVPTVLFGPGSIQDDAHTVDESIRVDDLLQAARAYHNILQQLLS